MPQTLAQHQPKPRDSADEEQRILLPFDTSFEHIGKVLAALGTHCFIPTLPPPTPQLKQDLRALPASQP